MWELYVGKGQPGVAIRIEREVLEGLVGATGRVSDVTYVDHRASNAPVDLDDSGSWPFVKLEGYRHEREVRVLVPNNEELVQYSDLDGRWAYLKDTDLLSSLSEVRLRSPRYSELQAMVRSANHLDIDAEVHQSSAVPSTWVRSDGDWWQVGLQPGRDWKQFLPTLEMRALRSVAD
jgi:hypothetical protein